jgi:protein-S-isoprenylcysteine O-methyltransferase Ste14
MPMQTKVVVFILVSGYFIWLSRSSLTKVSSHGFYRFFAWEAILALILLNLDFWFDDWLCYRQLASWVLLSVSAYLVTHGALTLYKAGRPDSTRSNTTLIGIEKTTALVTTGIYRYIRHPVYSSAVIGVWGVVLKGVSAVSISLALISIILLTAAAKMEEAENIQYFGKVYKDYMSRSRMFIPYLF